MIKTDAGMFYSKPKKTLAIRVGDILKQPTLDFKSKTHLPDWVHQAWREKLIMIERTDSNWHLRVITRTAGYVLACRADWLLLDPADIPNGLSVIANKRFHESYVPINTPLTERERTLESDLAEARAASARNYEKYVRAYPGELPGRDSMG